MSSSGIAAVIAVSVFALAALAIVYGVSAGRKKKALKAEHPDEPWMWRDDWARGFIRDSNRRNTAGLWVFALIWSAISFPIAWKVGGAVSRENLLPLIVVLFPLVGVILLIGAIYSTLRSVRFGTSICHLDRMPVVPGRAFRGDVELKTDLVPAGGYRLRILLVNVVTTGTGKHRSTRQRLLWDSEIVVESNAVMRSPVGTRVPFQFATPPDSNPTDEHDLCDRYIWSLTASAELPGVDYSAEFDLPVFETGEKADGSEFAAFTERRRAHAARHRIAPGSGVEIVPMPGGGEQFRLQAAKSFWSVLATFLFLAFWNAIIAATIRFGAPWGVPAVLIALDLLFIAATIDYFFGRSTIEIDAGGVRVRKQWLGIAASPRSFEASTIESVDGTTAGPKGQTFGVTLNLGDEGTHLLAANLRDRETAEAVAARMMSNLRRGSRASEESGS